jgi:hypothetical protein
METLILHTTRGMLNPERLSQAQAMHNAFVTEGSQPGIEIARSLGDLSHNLYTPVEGLGKLLAASPGELLFIDQWADAGGMETFFSNPFAQGAGTTCIRSVWKRSGPPRAMRSHSMSQRWLARLHVSSG